MVNPPLPFSIRQIHDEDKATSWSWQSILNTTGSFSNWTTSLVIIIWPFLTVNNTVIESSPRVHLGISKLFFKDIKCVFWHKDWAHLVQNLGILNPTYPTGLRCILGSDLGTPKNECTLVHFSWCWTVQSQVLFSPYLKQSDSTQLNWRFKCISSTMPLRRWKLNAWGISFEYSSYTEHTTYRRCISR